MRAVIVDGGRPVVTEAPAPAGDGVRVRVRSASICGSDFHLMAMGALEGAIPGHELAGVTDDGTEVAIEPFVSCEVCPSCRRGDRHRCEVEAAGIGIGLPGGMAEEIVVPPQALVRLPSGVDVGVASLVEPLAVAVHAVRRSGVTPGERVAVIGAGAIGLATAAALVAAGAEVEVAARHDAQREAAERVGARIGVGDGYRVVLDAVGSTESLADAVRRCRPEGRVCVVGTFWEPVRLDVAAWLKEVEVVPAAMYGAGPAGRDVDAAAALLANRPVVAEALVTHRFPLDAAPEAFATAADRAGGAIKVVVDPSA